MSFRVLLFGAAMACVTRLSAGVVDVTITSTYPFFETSDDTSLYCYYTGTLIRQNSYEFGVEVDTGSGTGFTPERSSGPVTGGYRVHILDTAGDSRVGAFSCQVWTTDGSQTEKAITFKMKREADVWPVAFTVTANPGDRVVLQMEQKSSRTGTLVWRKGGVGGTVLSGQNGLNFTIPSVQSSHEGFYECYYQGDSDTKQGIMRLIVRACAENKWGPPSCISDCPVCYNGGVCDDNTGDCVCPPGFKGASCEFPCPANSIGTDCDKACDGNDCTGKLLCVMDPYGCSCAPGLMGIECTTDCPDGMHGAGCTQTCHCANGPTDCDKKTGACTGGCLQPWSGDSCHIAPDFLGYFTKTVNKALSRNNDETIDNISPGECARRCLQGTTTVPLGQCKSFDYYIFGSTVQCVLSKKSTADGVNLVTDSRFDYYHRTDFGPCTSFPCLNGGTCTEGSPSYTCTCIAGWVGNNCEDMDECTAGIDNCDTQATCTNTVGSFICTCEPGYTGDGVTCTACSAGTYGPDCTNTCHCADGNSVCPADTGVCTSGGCAAGWEGVSTACQTACTPGTFGPDCANTCHCAGGDSVCPADTGVCTSGGCVAGWEESDCQTDVDECNTGAHNCDPHATCTNTPGSFTCACNQGYYGTGTSCTVCGHCSGGDSNCDTTSGTCSSGCVTPWTGTLCKQISPTVTHQPGDQRISLGQTASFSCTGHGKPLESVSWSRDGTLLTDGGRVAITTANGTLQYTVIGTLNISNIVRSDNGQYTCTVTNTAGTATSQPATLAVLEPPYNVRVTVTAQSDTTLRVSWTVGSTGNADIETSEVRHKRSDATSWSSWISTGSTGTQGTYNITGLTAATDYDVQVRVRNSEGWSTPVQASGRTRDAPPGPPSNLQAPSASHDSISLTWQQPAVTNGVITHYSIQYGDTTTCSAAELTDEVSTQDSSTSQTIPNLTPYTTYSFRVRAFSIAGPGDYTDCLNARTTEFIPTKPTSVELSDVNMCNCEAVNQPRTIELRARWRRPQQVYGELRGYNLKLQQQDLVIYDHNITQGLGNDELTYVLSENDVAGLEPTQRYSLTVSAYNDVYGGEVSNSAESLTSDGCPTAPLVSKIPQEGVCAVNWTEPSGGKGNITGYSVAVCATRLGTDFATDTPSEPVITSNLSWAESLARLPAYSLVQVTVRAITCSEGEASKEINCTVTRIAPPDTIPNVTVDYDLSVTSTSFGIILPSISQRNGPISCYQVIVVPMLKDETVDDLTVRVGRPQDVLTDSAPEDGKTTPYIALAYSSSSYEEQTVTIGTNESCTDPCCHVGAVEGAPKPGNRKLSPGSAYTATVRAYVDPADDPEDASQTSRTASRVHMTSLFMQPIITAVLVEALPWVAIVVAVVVVVVVSFAAGAGFMFYRRKYMKPKKEATPTAKDVPLSDITSDQESNIEGTDNKAFSLSEPNTKCYHRFSEIRTVDDVSKYLKENNFGEYAKSFKDHDVDGDALKYLDDAILKDLIPKAGPRARFKGILVEMKQENDSQVTALNFWEIPRTSLKLGKRLGSGQFGEVRLGELRNRGLTTIVAVKTLRDLASESDKKDLLGELEILVTVGRHDNIISLVGACTKGGPLMIVVEYAPNGCLKDWLKTNSVENNTLSDSAYQNQPVYASQLSMEQLIQFGVDVASGMSHLAAMQCVHRDLAARNILLGENLVAKVSDFGLSRDIYEDSEYVKSTKSKLPLRWMAYESLFYNVYTTQSDVWSFGVLLWEIMAMGNLPYEGMKGKRMMDMIKDGGRLKKPSNCPEDIYTLMKTCWETLPEDRPTFPELRSSLIRIMQGFKTYASLLK